MIRNAELPCSDAALTVSQGSHHSLNHTASLRLRRVCAWCRRIAVNRVEWADERWSAADEQVTHGICPECAANLE